MSSLVISIFCTCCIFGGALFGMLLRNWLPEDHLRDDSRETIKVGAGMIATMAALVLGLLVASAKASFDTISTEVTQTAAKIILIDRLLSSYGPETKSVREHFREGVKRGIQAIWPEGKPQGASEIAALDKANDLDTVRGELFDLKPASDLQRHLLDEAMQAFVDLRQTKWLVIEQAQNDLPLPFLVVLLFWLTALHLSFGLFSPRNLTTIIVLFICSASVSSALFLIFELNHPLHGVVKVSAAPMRNALEHLTQ